MKTADEMFEELGYKIQITEPINEVCHEYYNNNTRDIIQFWYDKTVSKNNEDVADYITMQELQAINKKCQELKWI